MRRVVRRTVPQVGARQAEPLPSRRKRRPRGRRGGTRGSSKSMRRLHLQRGRATSAADAARGPYARAGQCAGGRRAGCSASRRGTAAGARPCCGPTRRDKCAAGALRRVRSRRADGGEPPARSCAARCARRRAHCRRAQRRACAFRAAAVRCCCFIVAWGVGPARVRGGCSEVGYREARPRGGKDRRKRASRSGGRSLSIGWARGGSLGRLSSSASSSNASSSVGSITRSRWGTGQHGGGRSVFTPPEDH